MTCVSSGAGKFQQLLQHGLEGQHDMLFSGFRDSQGNDESIPSDYARQRYCMPLSHNISPMVGQTHRADNEDLMMMSKACREYHARHPWRAALLESSNRPAEAPMRSLERYCI